MTEWIIQVMRTGEILYVTVASWLLWKNSSIFLPASRAKISKQCLFKTVLEKHNL